jgi:hypothetical protein
MSEKLKIVEPHIADWGCKIGTVSFTDIVMGAIKDACINKTLREYLLMQASFDRKDCVGHKR